MGIRYLNSYMFKNCRGGVEEIDIRREIEYHKRTFNIEKPAIIIDIAAIHKLVYTNEKEKLFGGRFDLYNLKIDEVFKTLVNLGVEIVCIQDGSLYGNKMDTKVKRRNEGYRKEHEILQQIEKYSDLNDPNLNFSLPDLKPFFINLQIIAKKYGTLIVTPREGDQEVVYQANKRNALAVISHDTDFLIFDGNWQFWSGSHLNLKKLSIIRFNKGALRAHLSLSPVQMILFATISGNDFVKYEMVEQFHKRFEIREKFDKIARVVRKISSRPPNLKKTDEKYLIKLIFHPKDRIVGLEDFRKSISFYCDVNESTVYTSQLMERASQTSFLYSILADIPINLSLFFFDLKKDDFIPYYQLIKPILQRQIGTILKNGERNLNSLSRSILTKLEHDDSYKIIDEIPIYPNDDLPPLENFILVPTEKNNELYQIKLKLFCWHILPECEYFKPNTITSCLPDEVVVTVSIITYLCEKRQISFGEADDILFACVHKFDSKQLIQLDAMKSINERNARVAFLFTNLYTVFHHSIQILGLTNFESLITFDGLYYHFLRHHKQDKVLRLDLKNQFKNLRIYSKEKVTK